MHRELIEKPIWKTATAEQKAVLITVLILANHRENTWIWQGKQFSVQPGQFITSSTNLAAAAGVSRQNVRSALLRLTKYGFLTYESTKTGMLVSIVNWEIYQGNGSGGQPTTQPRANQEPTKGQPRANQGPTTNKNDKNDKNDKNVNPMVKNAESQQLNGRGESTNAELQTKKTKEELRAIYNSYSFSDDLKQAVNDWLIYKNEKRQSYKPQGLKSLLSQIKNNSTKYGDEAMIYAINESMASNYEGIVWEKAKNQRSHGKQKPDENPYFELLKEMELEGVETL